ncbi:MAG: hypothetical protein LKJ69_06750 [Lactobacillus sp.]|jgi:hypothetical protein|nr:hypothetical protein [Lactobacillus sp.]MCI2033088.1 hypothetical protein [Lactobacillus sp.]
MVKVSVDQSNWQKLVKTATTDSNDIAALKGDALATTNLSAFTRLVNDEANIDQAVNSFKNYAAVDTMKMGAAGDNIDQRDQSASKKFGVK